MPTPMMRRSLGRIVCEIPCITLSDANCPTCISPESFCASCSSDAGMCEPCFFVCCAPCCSLFPAYFSLIRAFFCAPLAVFFKVFLYASHFPYEYDGSLTGTPDRIKNNYALPLRRMKKLVTRTPITIAIKIIVSTRPTSAIWLLNCVVNEPAATHAEPAYVYV